MLRRKTLQGDSKIERVELRLRSALHGLIHELLQAQISTSFTYKLPLLIEAIQFFWFCIHSKFDFLWSVNVASWLRSAVKYFQVDDVLREGNRNSSVFLILFYVFFIIQLIMFLLMIGTAFALVRSKRKTSTVLTYSLKTLSVYGLLINNVLILPSFQMFITTLICYKNDPVNRGLECYSGFYFFHFAVGIIGFIISFVVSLMFTLLYIELNPYSKIPFAAPQSKINLGKLLLKLIIVLYISLDNTFSIDKGFIAVYGIIWAAILVFRYRSTPPYDRSVFRFSIGLDSIILWAAIIANIHAFIDTGGADNVGLVFLFLGSPLAAYAAITIIERRAVGYRKIIVKNLNKDTDVEMYLNTVFRLIENRDKPAQRMILEGVLRYHTRHCTKKEADCVCYTLSRDYMKEEEAPEKLWYIWIKGIIVDVLEKFPKSARLHILYAYIQREKLNNKYKALFEMMIAKDNKPNVEQEFSIFRYKSLIEEEIIEEDSRTSETKGIDVNVIVHFQNSFVTFQAALENSVDLHLEFWRELLETNPGIYKLQSLGSMITHSVEEIGERYKKLNEINPNHIKMLQSYGNFLKNIVNDDVEGQRVLEKAEYVIKSAQVNKQFIENDRLKYGENSNTCIITVSGNFNKMGTIKNVNNEITRILGFSKTDIIGQNVNRIIPKYLAEIHDTLMRRYFETSETKIIGQERVVFPLSKKGYVVPCTLMIKILPNLDNGVRLVGFLNEVEGENSLAKVNDFEAEEKVHYIVYSGDTGAIHGYTQSCRKEFGLPSSLIYGAAATNDFTMDVVFPDLLNHNIEDLKNPAGVVTTLDTSTLQQDYLLAHTESDKSEYEEEEEQEEEEEEKKFRKTSVKAVLVEDAVYLNLNMRVLKFTEILDDKDMRKVTSVRNENEYKEEKSVSDKGPNHTRNEEAADDKFVGDENGGSDKDSNPSLAEGGEELKALKDFKALISEKTEPKSIKTLSRAIIALLLLLVVLACVELSFRLKQANEFDSGLSSIVQAYQRHDLMANINFKIRQLNNLAFNITSDDSANSMQWQLKAQLITLIDNLSNIQFNIMKASEVISADGTDTFDSQTITLEHLQETGQTDLDYRIYTDAVFQYITAASALRNTTLSSLKNGPSDTSVKNFFFVRKNGLGPLRAGSEAEANNFYNYYIKKTNTYNTTFLIIMIVGIVVLVISELILIPIVFSVHKTNNRVLSLFGYIPEEEIDELVAKCKDYMENYLEEHREQRDYSFEGSEEDIEPSNRPENVESSYLEISQNQDVADGEAPDMSLQLDVSEKIKASPITVKSEKVQDSLKVPMGSNSASARNANKSPVVSANMSPNKSVTNLSSGQEPLVRHRSGVRGDREEKNATKEEDRKKEDADLEAERAFNKSQKLLNSKDNRRSKVMIQFIGIALLFFFYFLLDYLWIEMSFLSNIKMNLQHLKLSASRTSQIRYLNAFTLEEISVANHDQVYTFGNQPVLNPDLRIVYNTLIQYNNKEITAPSNLNFAKTFDDYLATFNSYTNNDVCEIYYGPLGKKDSCDALGSGLLNSGITLAITTIALNTNDVINNFYNEINTSSPNAAQLQAIQYKYASTSKLTTAQKGMDMLMPPLNSLMNSFGANYESYLSTFKQGEIIKFVIYILFCVFVFVLLWLPYRKNLSDKIFRTKGMLNMIPMEIITKNEGLKGLFLAGDILQGVK